MRVESGDQDDKLQRAPDHYLEGTVQGSLVVSVPETTSQNTAAALRAGLEGQFKCPVVLVTHNIEFLRAEQLSPGESAKILAQVETQAERKAREAAEAKAAAELEVAPAAQEGEPSEEAAE